MGDMSPTRAVTLGIAAFAAIGVIALDSNGPDEDAPGREDQSALAEPVAVPAAARSAAAAPAEATSDQFDSWAESAPAEEVAAPAAPAADAGDSGQGTVVSSGPAITGGSKMVVYPDDPTPQIRE